MNLDQRRVVDLSIREIDNIAKNLKDHFSKEEVGSDGNLSDALKSLDNAIQSLECLYYEIKYDR